jgi:hypothetical protein
VLKKSVSRQHGVVRLNDSGGNLGRRVDGESQLGLLSVVDGQALQKKSS